MCLSGHAATLRIISRDRPVLLSHLVSSLLVTRHIMSTHVLSRLVISIPIMSCRVTVTATQNDLFPHRNISERRFLSHAICSSPCAKVRCGVRWMNFSGCMRPFLSSDQSLSQSQEALPSVPSIADSAGSSHSP